MASKLKKMREQIKVGETLVRIKNKNTGKMGWMDLAEYSEGIIKEYHNFFHNMENRRE